MTRLHTRLAACSATAVLALGIAISPLHAGPPEALDQESLRLTPDGGSASAVAINPADPALVIAAADSPFDIASGVEMYYSTDGGSSWPSGGALPGTQGSTDPTVAWSPLGDLAYAATVGGLFEDIFFFRSNDGGVSWDDLGQVLVADTPGGEFNFARYPKLHVDTFPGSPYEGNIYLMWSQNSGMKLSISADSGLTWSAPLTIAAGLSIGHLTTDDSGNLFYSWADHTDGLAGVLRTRISRDGGVTFEPQLSIADLNSSAFGYSLPYVDTTTVGFSISSAVDTSGGVFNGRIYVAWTDNDSSNTFPPENNHAVVRVAHSSDGGASWNVVSPHRMDNIAEVDRFGSWLAVAEDGVVYVTFLSTQQTDRQSARSYASFSIDGGVSFSAPAALISTFSPRRESGEQTGAYNGLSLSGDQLIATMSDTRDEDGSGPSLDVYAAGLVVDDYVGACLGIGTDGSLGSSEHGIRFTADRSFSAIEFRIAGSTSSVHVADIELRRSTGFDVAPEVVVQDVTALLDRNTTEPPFRPDLRIDLGTIAVSGTETFTVKFTVTDGGDGNVYFESFGEGNVECSDIEITDEVTGPSPAAASSPAGFKIISDSVANPPGGGCEVAGALPQQESYRRQFATLYTLRDGLFAESSFGRELISIHRAHSWDAAKLLFSKPSLAPKLARMLEATAGASSALALQDRSGVLTKEAIGAIEDYLLLFAGHADPELRDKLLNLWNETALWRFEGQAVVDVWSTLSDEGN